MTCQATGFVLAYSTRHELLFVEWALNPNGRLLVLPMIAEPLFHKQAHLALHISTLIYRIHSQARGFSISSLPCLHWHYKSQSQGGSFQFSPSLISLWPTVKAWYMLCLQQQSLIKSSGIWPILVAITFIVCGASGTSLGNNSLGGTPSLTLGYPIPDTGWGAPP